MARASTGGTVTITPAVPLVGSRHYSDAGQPMVIYSTAEPPTLEDFAAITVIPERRVEWLYEVLAFDGTPLAAIPARARNTTRVLNDAGQARFTLPLELAGEYSEVLRPGEVDLLVSRAGVPWLRGPLGAPRMDLPGPGGSITFPATGMLDMLDERFVPAGRELAALEQTEMAWQLIADTQALPNGDLGITAGLLPDSIARTKVWESPLSVKRAIAELAALEQGFDYEVDALLAFNAYYPRRGDDRAVVLEVGRNIASISVEYVIGPNTVTAEGADQVSVEAAAEDLQLRMRRREARVSVGDADEALLLGDRARGELAHAGLIAVPRLTLLQGAPDATPDDFDLGDVVAVVARAGWLNLNGLYRITEIDVTISDPGAESVSVVVVPL
ncbi:MAG: hypothetical protein H0W81_11980 [Chloroflexi bacterium]|nr:hypothetical protein [Chloroflexota bacterium]